MNNLFKEQEKFFDIAGKIINSNKVSHAYLIEINNYEDDYKYIKHFVKMILCNSSFDSDRLSDKQLNICNLIDSDNYPDLKVVYADGQWIKKEQLLNLKGEYQNKSLIGNKRIYIIREADKLNLSSANTILKFLEEPEDDIIAILLTTNRYKVLETILSRCQILSLQKFEVDNNIDDNLINLMKFIIKKDDLFINYKQISESILVDKFVAYEILSNIENILISYLNNKVLSNTSSSELELLLSSITDNDIIKIVKVIEEELPKLKFNVNYKLWLDSIFSRFVEV